MGKGNMKKLKVYRGRADGAGEVNVQRLGNPKVQCSGIGELVKSRFLHFSVIPVNLNRGRGQTPESSKFNNFWMPDPSSRTPIRNWHDG
jgi:hypothetical protein